ncbi:wax ester/triacylglycerol synthase family O-acyltransferase [Nocardioides campestrisoli]|uniref:wax ester/triacylglycerol synthase family O-acyltransferase n=1 Tax=Nocardioides campestrisoli TaxID=2736757 RepID=UPI0015E718F6|nr:wax ester/triacylglycerol synthase family O-acyltransferase [Nocardioides campestrisoli]
MHRLAGSDAGFLFIEGETQTSTCVDVVLLAPASPDEALTPEVLRARVAARLPTTPGLRRRMRPVPGGLGHGLWVDDPTFALDRHLHHVVLPAPGEEAQLRAHLAEVLPLLLDRTRPMWALTLVDGLAEGRQALVFQFHHTLADGAGLLETITRLLDDRAAEVPPAPGSEPAADPARDPGAALVLVLTLWHQLVAWLAAPRLLVRTVRRFRAVERRRATAEVRVPGSLRDAPATVLNRSADSNRDFARARLEMADVRAVRGAVGCTVSDVVLAVVTGALRDHLDDRDELPDKPLVANVPVGHEPPGAGPRTTGNHFSNYFALLPTHLVDPRDQLAAVSAATEESKHQLRLQGMETIPAWIDRIPPLVAARVAARLAARQREGSAAPDFNVLISNMRVSGGPWTLHGREVEDFFMTGPVADGAGLNITVTGYGDHLTLALVVNPSAVERPELLALGLEESMARLRAATVGTPVVPRRGDVA